MPRISSHSSSSSSSSDNDDDIDRKKRTSYSSSSSSDNEDDEETTRSTLASLSRLRSHEGCQIRVKLKKGKGKKRALLKMVRSDSSCDVEFRDGTTEKRVDVDRIVLASSSRQHRDSSGEESSSEDEDEDTSKHFSRGDRILCKLSASSTHWTRANIYKIHSRGRCFDVKIPDESSLFTKKRHYVLRRNIPRSRILVSERRGLETEFQPGDHINIMRRGKKKYRGTIRKSREDGTYDVEIKKSDESTKLCRRVLHENLSLRRRSSIKDEEVVISDDALSGDLQDRLRRHVAKLARRGVNCRQPFYDRDFNRNGIIDCDKFQRALCELQLPISERTLDLITDSFSSPDFTTGGGVQYESFLRYIDAPMLRIPSPKKKNHHSTSHLKKSVYPVARGALRRSNKATTTRSLIVEGCDRHTKPRLFVDLS